MCHVCSLVTNNINVSHWFARNPSRGTSVNPIVYIHRI
ncbi:hypothetical protein NJ7G_1215 [Natrinema sp. J7-2]|nr:hypothetical protein NJ7G_1215 [Natrinema sp. J7-2]